MAKDMKHGTGTFLQQPWPGCEVLKPPRTWPGHGRLEREFQLVNVSPQIHCAAVRPRGGEFGSANAGRPGSGEVTAAGAAGPENGRTGGPEGRGGRVRGGRIKDGGRCGRIQN